MRSNGVIVFLGRGLAARRPCALCFGLFPCQTGAHGQKASISIFLFFIFHFDIQVWLTLTLFVSSFNWDTDKMFRPFSCKICSSTTVWFNAMQLLVDFTSIHVSFCPD